MRNDHWTCSKLADKIRGTKKLKSGTAKEWTNWKKAVKTAHPIRFWIADEGLTIAQNIVYWPYETLNNIRYYFRNRWITQSHALVAHNNHLKRGQWCDVGNRFLPCLFNSLVDFVEIELASMASWNSDKYKLPFWNRIEIIRLGQWRNREAGLAHLDWEIDLKYGDNDGISSTDKLYGKPTHQAIAAKEIKDLYLWWTDIYSNRPDPYDVSGYTACCDEKRKLIADAGEDTLAFFDHENESKELREKIKAAHKILTKIEKDYEKEDTRMLTRLIKIREKLWS
jgi:hypothetical protein